MRRIVLAIACLSLMSTVSAQMVTKTYTASSSVSIDGVGPYGHAMPAVSFSSSDFSGCAITDVDVVINWAKTSGSCSSPDGDNSYHAETSFRIDGPSGNQVLAVPGTWSGSVSTSSVTTTFSQQASVFPSGTPTTGTFKPHSGNLSAYNNTSPFGSWNLAAGDNTVGDPLCITWYSVVVTAAPDNTGPTVSGATDQTIYTSGSCGAMATYNVTASDLCGVSSLNVSPTSPHGFAPGNNTVTYSATDVYGNVTSGSFTITVIDNENPTISCPSNISVNATSGLCGATVGYTVPTGSDNCSATVARTAGLASGALFPVGTTTVTHVATDPSSNTASCTFTVTVTDAQNPVITCPANVTVSNDPGVCGAAVTYSIPTATDNCPGVSVARIAGPASGSTFSIGTTSVTHRATDASSNTATCSFTITVNDTEAPTTVGCPSTITVGNDAGQCSAVVSWTPPTVSDNCSGATIARTGGQDPGTTFGFGTTGITYTATDAAGNTASCSFNVVVNDTEDPTVTCPSDITENAVSGQCSRTVAFANATYTDNCTGTSVAQTGGAGSGSVFPTGASTISFTATDAVGNTAACSFTITIVDNQDPVITCPSDYSVNAASGTCAANVAYSVPTATDNCSGFSVALTTGPASGGSFPVGTTVVTYTATDASSNTASCSFNVVVSDAEDPAIVGCPSNITVSNDAGQCDAVVSWTVPNVTDNCSGATIALVTGSGPGNTFPLGTTAISYTATDGAGNTASCNFNVVVNDNEDPTITCPANITENNSPGLCGRVVNFSDATASDNCPGVSVSQTAGLASGGFFAVGTSTVTYTATDASSNTASCSFTVTISDNEAPQFLNCPADITVNTQSGVCQTVVTFATLLANDNCDGTVSPVQTSSLGNGSTFPLGTSTVTYTATDGVPNVGTCTFTVTVEDHEAPQLNCPSDQTVTFDGSCQYDILDYTSQVSFLNDNCDGSPVLVQSPVPTTTITGSTEISITATDASGNETTCTFFVNPNDIVNPTITCPGDQQVQVNSICQFTLPDYTGASVVDDCDPSPAVVQNPLPGAILTLGATVTLTATDGSGNSSSCTFQADPLDATDPSILCPSNQLETVDGNCEFVLPSYTGLATATDNCVTPTVTQSPVSGTTIGANTLITLTATDGSSNSSTCAFTVVIDDNTDPTITCPSDQAVSFNSLCQFTMIDYRSQAVVGDNCDPNPSVVQVPSAGTSIGAPSGVQITVTDDAGNSASCTFNVTPSDNTNPNVVCPSDQVVDVDGNCLYAMADFTSMATATDNCDNTLSISQSPVATTVVSSTTTVVITAQDDGLNSGTCSFDVILQDVTLPSITCGADINVSFDANCSYSVGNYIGTPTVSDNCTASPAVTQSPSVGTIITGQTVITLTATDGAGNSASCSFNLIPDDSQVPVITCPATQNVNLSANCDFALADYTGLATATDNCDLSVTVTQSPAFGAVITANTSVTLTAMDDAGNTSTCSFSVDPSDVTSPSVSCPADQTESFSTSCDFVLPDYTGLGSATDNCDNAVLITQSPAPSTSITGGQTITLTAVDDAGNNSTCTFSVLPSDNTDPTVSCPADMAVAFNAQCQFLLTDYTGLATAADNCDADPAVAQSPVSGTSVGSVTTVTITATDANGNSGTCTFVITPSDGTAPSISCAGDQSVSLDVNCNYDLLDYTGMVTVNDNCDPAPAVSQNPAVATGVNTTTTVTITATDFAGNSSSCTLDVIPSDNTDPSITCPADMAVSFDANCLYSLTDQTGSATVSDNCDASPSVVQSPSSGTDITGTTTVTLTATDASGNLSTCTYVVTPSDNQNPTIVCPADQTVSSNASCQFVIVDYTASGSVADNCDVSPTVSQSPAFGTVITVATTVTLTAQDASNNSSTCTFLVTPADNNNPSISCPGDQLEDFDANCQFVMIDYTGLATATDNCSASPTITQNPATGTITGQTTITLTATDADLNTATCTFDVIPADNTAPVMTCPPDMAVSFNALCQFIIQDYTASATANDNCDTGPTITQSPVVGTLIGSPTIITVSGTDAAGNIGSCTFTVTPSDGTPPTLACPADQTESFDASCSFTMLDYTAMASVDDNCDVGPFSVGQSPLATTLITGPTTVTFTVSDGSGNSSICTFQVLPEDDVDPTISCPTDQPESFDVNCSFSLTDYTSLAVASDNCDDNLAVVQTPLSGTSHIANTTVTLSVTDLGGNSASCSFNVLPVDDTAPTVACPSDLTVNVGFDCTFALPDYTGQATISDNCDFTPFATQSPGIGSLVTGDTQIIITVIDDAGNTSSCMFNVLPVDNTVPTITCPDDQLADQSASCDFALGDYTSLATATDNCDAALQIVQSPVAGTTVSASTTITLTAIDDAGNSSVCSFQVVIEDNTAPTLTCPSDMLVDFNPNCQFITLDYTGLPTVSDNCDPSPSVTQLPLTGSSIGGATVVTLYGTDVNGNVGSCTFTITPEDHLAPIIIGCPADIFADNDPEICEAVVNYATISATDNCTGVIVPQLTAGLVSGSVFPMGTTPVTYTATDSNGNSSACTFNVIVSDTENPVITCPANISLNVDPGICSATATYALPTVVDNCTESIVPVLESGFASGAGFPEGTTTVTYSADDGNGNTNSCSFTVTVNDDENPSIVCPADVTENVNTGACQAFVSYSLPVATDNCTSGIVPSLVSGPSSGSVFQLGPTTVIYEATDASGNVSSCSFTVTVVDNEPPFIPACPLDITMNVEPATCGATIVYASVTATDNCSGTIVPLLTSGLASGSVFPLGLTTVTYTATDGSGNSSTCSFDVMILDNIDPVIVCPSDMLLNVEPNTCGATTVYTLPTVTDNCTTGIVPSLEAGLASGEIFPLGVTVVTYLADDGNGNTSTCSFNVTIEDNEDPVILCPADISVNVDPETCGAAVTFLLPDVTDNCTSGIIPDLTAGLSPGSTFPLGTTTETYLANDGNGNTSSCSFTVTVIDNEPPVLLCSQDITVNVDPGTCQAVVVYDAPVAVDNCTQGIVPLLVSGLASGDSFPLDDTQVVYSADDGHGNITTCSFTVTVVDNEPPDITCPANQMEAFDPVCELVLPDYIGLAVTQDNCDGDPVVTQSPVSGTVVGGVTTVTLTSTDFAGNSSSCTFDVIDSTPPSIECPQDQLVGSDISCEFMLLDYTTITVAADNCGGVSLSQDPVAGAIISTQTTVTVTAEDDFGNTSNCTFEVIPEDNIAPSLTCIGNQSTIFDGDCLFELPDYSSLVEAEDNCTGSPTVTQSPAPGTMIAGQTTLTMMAQDGSGNSVSCSFEVTPSDHMAPAVTCPANQPVLFDGNCEFTMQNYAIMVDVQDNCSNQFTFIQSPAAGTVESSNTVVTITAEDPSGNSNSCAFVVIPSDGIAPSIVCPADVDVDFDSNCAFNLTDYTGLGSATDNCASYVLIGQSPNAGTVITATQEVTLTADDGNGNTSSCTFNVIPSDNMPPSIICMDDQTVSFDQNCEYVLLDYAGSAITDDNCSINIIVSQDPSAASVITGPTEVTLTADDGNGNTTFCTFEIIPLDNGVPSIGCPADQEVTLNGNCAYSLLDYTSLATASDNCSGSVAVTQDLMSGTIITDTVAVTLTADDGFGNTASCTFSVNPSDQTAPSVSCPADMDVSFDSNCEYVVPNFKTEVVASDNCGSTFIAQDPDIGSIITSTTQVFITVDDGNGNVTSCSFFVNPSDDTAPVVTCPDNQSVSMDADCQFELPDYTLQTVATDNCSSLLNFGQFPPAGTFIVGGTAVTLTIGDGNGNTTECNFAVVPEDDADPEIAVCPGDQTFTLDANCQGVMPDFTPLITATDNCDQQLEYGQLPAAGSSLSGVQMETINVGAVDDAGNIAFCQFTLNVLDATEPDLVCPPDQTLGLNANCDFEVPDYTLLSTATDVCGSVSLTQSPMAGSVITSQLNATVIAEDESGNVATCTFFVQPVEMTVQVVGTEVTCQGGDDGTATVTVTGGNSPYSEDWGGFNPNALAQGNYAVTVSDVNGCTSVGNVSIVDGPQFDIAISPEGLIELCEGGSVLLDAGTGYAVYQWSTGASVSSINVSSAASYWVQVANADGCWSNTDTATVTFYDLNVPLVTASTDGLLSCSNDTAQSYQWYLNGNVIPDATDYTYCPLQSGNYVISLIDANGCTVQSGLLEYTFNANSLCATGIHESGLDLDIFPNPSTGVFVLKYALATQTQISISIYDMVGKEVTEKILLTGQTGTHVIDLSGQAEGIYLLRFTLGDQSVGQQQLMLVR